MARTDISVVIAVEDRMDALPTMLSYLEGQRMPASRYEVVIAPYRAHRAIASLVERYAAGAPMPVRCAAGDATTEVAAKNLGAQTAEGVWLLFLDQDLVASRTLVAAHVRKQSACGGQAILLGNAKPHETLPRGALTRWFMRHDKPFMAPEQVELPLHWTSRHCSLSRRLFLESGGFDAGIESIRAADLDLAWRMRAWDSPTGIVTHGDAFIWRAARFCEERHRFQIEGRDLYHLSARLSAPEIIRHFRLSCSRIRHWYEKQFTPFYARAFERIELDMRLHGQSCRRIFTHDMRCGARAAARENPGETPEDAA